MRIGTVTASAMITSPAAIARNVPDGLRNVFRFSRGFFFSILEPAYFFFLLSIKHTSGQLTFIL